ncbi:MAG TPA: hypothetical protein VGK00_01390 [Anaerolineales bacterium]
MKKKLGIVFITALVILTLVMGVLPAGAAPSDPAAAAAFKAPKPKFSDSVAFDVSPSLREMAKNAPASPVKNPENEVDGIRPERGPVKTDGSFSGDGALNPAGATKLQAGMTPLAIPSTMANFEGLSNEDNFNLFGFRVNPPDPNGEVGLNHYVEMTNLAFAVYDKQGNLLLGPVDTGTLWSNFAVPDCTDPSGDPIVMYDQFADRWLLTQFTTRGPKYFDCVAISQTGDPTGAYFRYAFVTQDDPELPGGTFFPDYPKYGVWKDSYIMTTRDFGDVTGYGISVYALEKNKMVNGQPKARAVQFFLDSNVVPLNLMGDGLLPPDVDGKNKPKNDAPAPIIGTQDDGAGYGGTIDALNIWELNVAWKSTPVASLNFKAQLPVAPFDSIFPCAPTSRDCLPQPGITNPAQYLDILSYRQRPTFRLAYRNFGTYEALVTNQSVEATPGMAGVRWYEIRRVNGTYSVYQQGTFAPGDGVHRWMGSAAMDWQGNIALGYSVVNGVDVFPGIRYTGRVAGDPLGAMTLGEGTIINGGGVQTTTNSRWGDYTSLTVDPVDDCTFWYVNEYYAINGTAANGRPWQTRIASFKLPGCFQRN